MSGAAASLSVSRMVRLAFALRFVGAMSIKESARSDFKQAATSLGEGVVACSTSAWCPRPTKLRVVLLPAAAYQLRRLRYPSFAPLLSATQGRQTKSAPADSTHASSRMSSYVFGLVSYVDLSPWYASAPRAGAATDSAPW